jgi:hypothetical protein
VRKKVKPQVMMLILGLTVIVLVGLYMKSGEAITGGLLALTAALKNLTED